MPSSAGILERFSDQLTIDLDRLAITQSVEPENLVVDVTAHVRDTQDDVYFRSFVLASLLGFDQRPSAAREDRERR